MVSPMGQDVGPPLERLRISVHSREPTDIERAYYRELIDALIARRETLGMTQEHLDHRLGVSQGQIAKWECFLRLPGAFMMTCWASALELDLIAVHRPPHAEGSKP